MIVAEYDRYGASSELRLREVPRPEPGSGEVLVRVRAAALNPKDILIRRGKFKLFAGPRFPKRVGFDWAGEAVACGPGVTRVKAGDALFGMIQAWSGGACGEYVVAREDELAPKPTSLSFTEAAALPLVSLTALQALRDLAGTEPGARVLVNGASGGVGVHAVQIARSLGARVTTTSSERNLELCRSLGAAEALDYAAGDVFKSGQVFDAVFDVFGNRRFADARQALAPRGVFISSVPSARILFDRARTLLSAQRALLVVVRSRTVDLKHVASLVDDGRLRPVVDRVYPLAEIAAAQDYLATKRARGKVVLSID